MITNICLLLEELSVLLCIHYLYGEKFKLDIKTTSYLTIYMIMMSAINYYHLPYVFTVISYPLIAIYCGLKFGWKWRELIINNILFLVIVGGIQLISSAIYAFLTGIGFFSDQDLLLINGIAFFIIVVILPQIPIYRLSVYLQDKERILVILLTLSFIMIIYSMINYKIIKGLEAYQYIPLFIGIILFFLLAGQLGKYKIKSKTMESELKMHQLYADSFYNLIEEIRMRQHEFDNHISTIYSLHYTCKTYNQLVEAQTKYSHEILRENRHNKLLAMGNPLLIGFLYGKIVETEKSGIDISYKISIGDLNVGIPTYKLVEILGNLIKNSVEALTCFEGQKALFIAISETNTTFEIEVRNKSRYIDNTEILSFFKKGFSKKGDNRGYGLYNVKSICDEYRLKIYYDNRTIKNENWFWIMVKGQKETTS